MPTYEFMNKDTGVVEEHTMSYTVLDQFKEDNPHLERHFSLQSLPGFGDGSRMNVPGAGKPDSTDGCNQVAPVNVAVL